MSIQNKALWQRPDFRGVLGNTLAMAELSAGLMAGFMPGHEWQETRAKIEAFRLFAFADGQLNSSRSSPDALDRLVDRALSFDDYRSVWLLEGIAHYFAVSASGPLTGMLSRFPGSQLPERNMAPMHTGMGTACAEYALSTLGGEPSKAALRALIGRFFDSCRNNARPEWLDSSIEPLGLVVRTLYPHLLSTIGDIIGDMDGAARRLYWHGVGRSLYFVPTNFLAFGNSHERLLRAAAAEAPHESDKLNALAGVAWAVTLVNIRRPLVLENFLRICAQPGMPEYTRETAINGITSALMIWRHMVPWDTACSNAYLNDLPLGTGNNEASRAALWKEWVVEPSRRVLQYDLPRLCEQRRVASVFSYRPETGVMAAA